MATKVQGQISNRVKEEMEKQNISLRRLAELTGLDHGGLSRLLNGKRPWQMVHLEAVAPALGLGITDLVSNFIEVPVLAQLTKNGFAYSEVCDPTRILGTVVIPPPRGVKNVADVIATYYGVEVQRDDISPFVPGTVLVAAHNSSDQLKSGDMCFYPSQQGKGCLKRIRFTNGDTLIGLALILTLFLMQPVMTTIHQAAIVPYEAGRVDAVGAVELGAAPLRQFMLKYAREKDLGLFLELAKEPRPARPQDVAMRVVVPAYILSELRAGFQIGAALYLPFLVVDMVVAAITTSVGMLQLPPVVISTPLKILLFVMVDGWNLLVGSLLKSFA
ncbi:MAG: helix-turn-helix domain-containing protein [Acidobacteriia bacterium]|nr:helix-turn-helix domain-containing protein [Terriglobia bacterium]